MMCIYRLITTTKHFDCDWSDWSKQRNISFDHTSKLSKTMPNEDAPVTINNSNDVWYIIHFAHECIENKSMFSLWIF
jgi:hypothetical protein